MSEPEPRDPSPDYAKREPVFNAPPGIVWLCGVIVAAHLISTLGGRELEMWLFQRLAFAPVYFWDLIGASRYQVPAWSSVTLVTHAFLHGSWMHLLVNTGMLLAFGALVERVFGLKAMLAVFLLGAVAGAVIQSLAEGDELIPMIGASGAVYAMMGLVVQLMLASRAQGMVRRGVVLASLLLLLNLLTGIAGVGDLLGGAAIAWQAHIGGFALGFLSFWPLRAWRRRRGPPGPPPGPSPGPSHGPEP